MKPILTSILLFTSLLTVNQSFVSQTNFQQEILAAHNKYRQQVNVSPLTWSNQLAR